MAMFAKHFALKRVKEIKGSQFTSLLLDSTLKTSSAKKNEIFRIKNFPHSSIEVENSLEKDSMVCCFQKEPDLEKYNVLSFENSLVPQLNYLMIFFHC